MFVVGWKREDEKNGSCDFSRLEGKFHISKQKTTINSRHFSLPKFDNIINIRIRVLPLGMLRGWLIGPIITWLYLVILGYSDYPIQQQMEWPINHPRKPSTMIIVTNYSDYIIIWYNSTVFHPFLMCGKKPLVYMEGLWISGFLHETQDFPPSFRVGGRWAAVFPLYKYLELVLGSSPLLSIHLRTPKNETISYGRKKNEENSESQAFFVLWKS